MRPPITPCRQSANTRPPTKKESAHLPQELRVLLAHGATVLNALHKNLKPSEVSNVTVLGRGGSEYCVNRNKVKRVNLRMQCVVSQCG